MQYIKLYQKYAQSVGRFDKMKKQYNIIGFCNWEILDDNKFLQSWNTDKGQIIVQFFVDGQGYEIFKNY